MEHNHLFKISGFFFHEIGTYLTRIIELLSKKRYNRLNNAAKLEIIFQRYSLR